MRTHTDAAAPARSADGEGGHLWLWRVVLVPLLLSRFALLAVALVSVHLPQNPAFPSSAALMRGWATTPVRLLDVWARWDSGWYMGIARDGYELRGRLAGTQSNVAFFPLYPFAVKGLTALLPAEARTDAARLAIGVALSNLLLALGLALVYRLVLATQGGERTARRTVLYMLLFPASFFFGCFLTEGAFLGLSALAMWAAHRRAWWAAGVAGALLALTRPNGVLIAVPLAVAYLAARDWKPRAVRADALWLLLVPAGLLGYMAALLPLTGDALAPLTAQKAWGKILSTPWETLFEPRYPFPATTEVERWLVLALLAVAVSAFWLLRDRSHAVYGLLFLAPPLFTGVLNSQTRYAAPVFPLFMALAAMTEGRPRTDWAIRAVFAAGLLAAFAAWCQLWWVG
jgi:hypothetical protein